MACTSPAYVAARLYLMLEALCNGEIPPNPGELDWATKLFDTLGLPNESKVDQYKTLVAALLYLMLEALCSREIRPNPTQLDWATKLFDTLGLSDKLLDEAEADHHKMLTRLDNFCPTCGAAAVVWENGWPYCLACGLHSEWRWP